MKALKVQRGYLLHLVMAMLASLSISGAIVFARAGEAARDSAIVDLRMQLTWATTSALALPPGTHRVGSIDVIVRREGDRVVATARHRTLQAEASSSPSGGRAITFTSDGAAGP